MKVKQLISKLQKVDQDAEVVLHDGFSVNAVELESVVIDRNQHVLILTSQEVEFDDIDDIDGTIEIL